MALETKAEPPNPREPTLIPAQCQGPGAFPATTILCPLLCRSILEGVPIPNTWKGSFVWLSVCGGL